ncbi:mannosylglycerate hydrolase [Microbulbifer aestuariivivens]|uniref:Mannosylglycerate hydrolase n=1 Tax=Microbulbifer aestuariivivens TaxID=1908308 RepID=A0ABP9WSF1_9GAMM
MDQQALTRDVAVVVQTHWDREWYFPHQTFLGRLLVVMEQVVGQLECGELHYFLFDGQVSAIDDFYQEAEPQLARKVRAYVAEGRIIIGPWYIMADEFLCSGESLVRNLELGTARASAHGNCQKVGYLPDTFGHISQMPQLLRGFGIDNAVAWRGIDAERAEVQWRAADGSAVFTVFLTEGYYQHPFNTADWQANLTSYLDKIATRSDGELLLTQGGDHLLTSESLQSRMESFNSAQSRYRLRQTTLAEHIARLRQNTADRTAEISGELRGNQRAFVLPDVLSTRVYLKQANQLIEDRLNGLVEPLLAVSDPQQYPANYLQQTWKLLIEQHAHDSICGCSVDAVHEEMEVRFRQLQQRLAVLAQGAQAALGMVNERLALHREEGRPSPFADDSDFSLFNPSPKAFSGWSTVEIFLAGNGDSGDSNDSNDGLVVERVDGGALDAVVLKREDASEFHSPTDDFPDFVQGQRYTVAIRTQLDGLQILACRAQREGGAKPAAQGRQARKAPSADSVEIENDFYRIGVDGEQRLLWQNKRDGRIYRDVLALVSEVDAGDSYNFSPLGDARYRAAISAARVQRYGGGISELQLDLCLRQPAGLDAERQLREGETVASSGVLSIRLLPDEPMALCQLHWHNRARDQRLRLHIPLQEKAPASAADSAFDWVRRDTVYRSSAPVEGQQETAVAVLPTYSAIKAGRAGFVHRGLQEAEVIDAGSEDLLAITLLRSVGWLSRRDLKTRGLGAGPDMQTPAAQCLGEYDYEFALNLCDPEAVTLLNSAANFRRPVQKLRGRCAREPQTLQLHCGALQVSSVRRRGTGIEVRLWNPSDQPVRADFDRDGVVRTDLAGAAISADSTVAPRQIATFRIPVGFQQDVAAGGRIDD